jgi:branched-chain amino acid transport system substrate-binding protein
MSALRTVNAAIVLSLLWSAAASAQTTAIDPIKIGWIGHLTGVLSAYGQDMLRAAEMAVEDVNASGGALGRKPSRRPCEGMLNRTNCPIFPRVPATHR